MVRSALSILIVIIILVGCKSSSKSPTKLHNPEVYIFLGHVYATDSTVDERIPRIRQGNHHFWLGGDLMLASSNSTKILNHLDYLFDLGSPSTHWAIGNHDYHGNFEEINHFSGKPDHYAVNISGITLIVVNSNIMDSGFSCEERIEQTDFINHVLDTVQMSSHVVLMSHHVFWGNLNEDSTDINTYANTNHTYKLWYCDPYLTACEAISEQLNRLVNENIKVILLAGDLGQKRSAYEYINKNGMVFLGNGGLSNTLYNSEKFTKASSDDSVLVFTHYPDQRVLNWKFINVGN